MQSAWPFQLAVFVGAFLLFFVQPMMAKQILPWFGGSPAVWTTCLLFFQVALVAGYAYAHVTKKLGVRRQVWLHLALLGMAILLLPIAASSTWKPVDASQPLARLLGLLTVTVAFPYVMLAATAPLLQDWFRLTATDRSPYRLYVLSNAGSLLALLSYPVLVERFLSVDTQASLWSGVFVLFVIACAVAARRALGVTVDGGSSPLTPKGVPLAAEPIALDKVLWVVLAACGSGLLLAVTNQLCQDIAVVPLLWIVPLALYLITFIVCFADLYRRMVWVVLFALGLVGTGYALANTTTMPVVWQGAMLLLLLTASCMVCHGELARIRPVRERLTSFYLAMSTGGALGGVFVAIVAPRLFTNYAELPFLAVLVPVLLVATLFRDQAVKRPGQMPAWLALAPVVLFSIVVVTVLRDSAAAPTTLATSRNFYGILRVTEDPPGPDRRSRRFYHGRVLHGAQLMDPALRTTPTTYFGAGSGVAVAFEQLRAGDGQPITVGVVGLGVGTLAAWGTPGDHMRFFELNPEVVTIAERYFSFLDDSAATIDIVTGDGRLALEREMAIAENRHSYDLFVADAFSGDSVPVHLLTRECFALYWSALGADGVLAINVSNHFVDLEPVVRGLAAERGLRAMKIINDGDPNLASGTSEWMLVTENAAFVDRVGAAAEVRPAGTDTLVWTDRFSSLVSVLR